MPTLSTNLVTVLNIVVNAKKTSSPKSPCFTGGVNNPRFARGFPTYDTNIYWFCAARSFAAVLLGSNPAHRVGCLRWLQLVVPWSTRPFPSCLETCADVMVHSGKIYRKYRVFLQIFPSFNAGNLGNAWNGLYRIKL